MTSDEGLRLEQTFHAAACAATYVAGLCLGMTSVGASLFKLAGTLGSCDKTCALTRIRTQAKAQLPLQLLEAPQLPLPLQVTAKCCCSSCEALSARPMPDSPVCKSGRQPMATRRTLLAPMHQHSARTRLMSSVTMLGTRQWQCVTRSHGLELPMRAMA